MNQPANQATDHPAHQPANHSSKKKQHTATWIALASAATAIVAAVISGLQVNLAGKQNAEAEQQQLVNLTSLIGQQLAQQSTPANNARNSAIGQFAAANASEEKYALLTVEGQAGAVLLHDLNGAGVAAVEYIQVGRALGASGDLAGAIAFIRDALTAPPNDALTHAEALRLLGSAYYTAGQIAVAHRYEMRAAHFPSLGHFLENPSYIRSMIAYAYLLDADFQIAIKGCRIALVDMEAAHRAVGSYPPNTDVVAYRAWDFKQYPSRCGGSG